MKTNDVSDRCGGDSGTRSDAVNRSEVASLFVAALDVDQGAKAALVLLGGYDDTAHRASVALATAGNAPEEPTPPDVLASIDQTLAVLHDRQRSS